MDLKSEALKRASEDVGEVLSWLPAAYLEWKALHPTDDEARLIGTMSYVTWRLSVINAELEKLADELIIFEDDEED